LDANKEDHEARLELARVYWATGKRDDAFVAYTRLAASGPYAKEIMPDLESITEIQDHPDWHRLMGDVYMKAGKLTYALDHYRRALSEL
jgi:cytochrome c-type biogenesis protein CcmH/NrfG